MTPTDLPPGSDAPPPSLPLCPEDAATLDALLALREAGQDTGPMPAGSAERAEVMRRLFAVLDTDRPGRDPQATLAEDDALIARTVAAANQARQRDRFTQQIEMLRQPRLGLGFSWRHALAAAAAFLIAVSLLFPTLDNHRSHAQRVAGMANLGRAGIGLSSYALANNGVLPKRDALPGSTWWNTGAGLDDAGRVQSNSAHLFQLVRREYVTVDQLASPANPHAPRPGELTPDDDDWKAPAQVSFSYQNQFTPYAIRLGDHAGMVVLADKNPLIVVRQGKFTFASDKALDASSPLHHARGQNMLFTHGAVVWSRSPVIENRNTGRLDNVYTAHGVSTYTGRELPSHEGDVQLVP
jgi:hypothetical protein